MKSTHWKPILILTVAVVTSSLAQNNNQTAKRRGGLNTPLVIASQGSFFIGGESKTLAPPPGQAAFGTGEVTVNQMYVQYQIPPGADRHVPVVMVHGCCLSSKTWETTPDAWAGTNISYEKIAPFTWRTSLPGRDPVSTLR